MEVVLVSFSGVEVDLRREVAPRVFFREHVLRRHLRVPEVLLHVRFVHASAQGGFVVSVGEHALAALAHDDGCARVLAPGQDHARGDVCVFEELEGDEAIVVARLRVREDVGELLQVARAQEVRDVGHALPCDQGQRLGLDAQDALAEGALVHAHVLIRELAPRHLLGRRGLKDVLIRERRRRGRLRRERRGGGREGESPRGAERGVAQSAGHGGANERRESASARGRDPLP